MKLMNFFRRPRTAPVARERLQILLAHERAVSGKSDLIAILQEEIMAVIAKHFPVDQEGIKVKMERGEVVSTLEVEVEIPTPMCPGWQLPVKRAPAESPRLSLVETAKPALSGAADPAAAGSAKEASAEPPCCVEEVTQPGA
jgi:cell division topological specificity factor